MRVYQFRHVGAAFFVVRCGVQQQKARILKGGTGSVKDNLCFIEIMPSKELVEHQVEAQAALVRARNAVAFEQAALQGRAEFAEAVP